MCTGEVLDPLRVCSLVSLPSLPSAPSRTTTAQKSRKLKRVKAAKANGTNGSSGTNGSRGVSSRKGPSSGKGRAKKGGKVGKGEKGEGGEGGSSNAELEGKVDPRSKVATVVDDKDCMWEFDEDNTGESAGGRTRLVFPNQKKEPVLYDLITNADGSANGASGASSSGKSGYQGGRQDGGWIVECYPQNSMLQTLDGEEDSAQDQLAAVRSYVFRGRLYDLCRCLCDGLFLWRHLC